MHGMKFWRIRNASGFDELKTHFEQFTQEENIQLDYTTQYSAVFSPPANTC